MIIRFTAVTAPHGKQRARSVTLPNGRRTSYTPKDTVAFENAIAWACKAASKGAKFGGHVPLEMTSYLYMPIPASLSKKQQELLNGEWHTSKPDGSNIIKSVEDALNDLLYKDDGQIAAGHFYKIYSDCPRVEVQISQLERRKGEKDG